jgi:hypothetical protein
VFRKDHTPLDCPMVSLITDQISDGILCCKSSLALLHLDHKERISMTEASHLTWLAGGMPDHSPSAAGHKRRPQTHAEQLWQAGSDPTHSGVESSIWIAASIC